ncbi:MAG: class I SAM-dependent methyltransferase [Mucilaginibacter sp.]|uniref:class I SAM-dependent DNA methyltransferase n=1 Tax=Mucilaginibacter sp. TaxID=1882438 RepID=UPI0032640623
MVFEGYSDFYDLFYAGKDYLRESEQLISILRSIKPDAQRLIELGSGTGNYGQLLCKAGYKVTGIEKSQQMLNKSRQKKIVGFEAILADMVSFDLHAKYDAIYSLFDVMCYLTQNSDLELCFKNAAKHLDTGGVFIFDSWFTPAVYTLPPIPNVKYAENSLCHITRSSQPIINYRENTVAVHYDFTIENKTSKQRRYLKEVHKLRHFSIPELEIFASMAGFKLLACEELLTGKPASKDTWKVCCQLIKQ